MNNNGSIFKKAELAWPDGDKAIENSGNGQIDKASESFFKAGIATSLNCKKWKAFSITPSKGVIGRFKLYADDKILFVRTSVRHGHPELEKKICDYLLENEVSVNPILVTKAVVWEDELIRLDIRPYINGRYYSGTDEELEKIGIEMALMHEIMHKSPFSSAVHEIALARYHHYNAVKELICSPVINYDFLFGPHADWAKKNNAWFKKMAEQFDPYLDKYNGSQCLHGQIHPANVIFEEGSDKAVFFDFEESVHHFAPLAWDLAFVVQRFILRDNPNEKILKKRIEYLENGYGREIQGLSNMMQQISWFSMAVIIDLFVNQRTLTSLSELEKFVRLENQACSYCYLV